VLQLDDGSERVELRQRLDFHISLESVS
jgi:hypothetical protein